jgi:hypothetical protein
VKANLIEALPAAIMLTIVASAYFVWYKKDEARRLARIRHQIELSLTQRKEKTDEETPTIPVPEAGAAGRVAPHGEAPDEADPSGLRFL